MCTICIQSSQYLFSIYNIIFNLLMNKLGAQTSMIFHVSCIKLNPNSISIIKTHTHTYISR